MSVLATDPVPVPHRPKQCHHAVAEHSPQIEWLRVDRWDKAFLSEVVCNAYLIARRWPDGVTCPRCGSKGVRTIAPPTNTWECWPCQRDEAYRFSHRTGTLFDSSEVPLRYWFRVVHLAVTSKRPITARRLKRYLPIENDKALWTMYRRISLALKDEGFRKLMGIVGRPANVASHGKCRASKCWLTERASVDGPEATPLSPNRPMRASEH